MARATIADYAPQLYGDLASHQELASAPITAAGLTGYAVRWHVVPSTGTQGYILLVALPSAGGGFSILVGSVDDDPSAPQPAVLEQIVAGIRVAAPANGV
ncbi:hypothetical protein [Kitasatospora mediocidica]|uniref:hypothetical protein n=1 Tax=Kitasatospora mediocidica TaxID=58352 RepID=UPI00055DDC25|nr:hypothetical protein [Kitasatospora mediocidica]